MAAALAIGNDGPTQLPQFTESPEQVIKNGHFTSYRLRSMFYCFAGICALLSIVMFVVGEFRDLRQRIADNYALTEVTEMVSRHVLRCNAVPERWNDLRADYRFVDQSYGLGPDGFETLQRRVSINFGSLAREVAATSDDAAAYSSKDWFIRVRNTQKSKELRDTERRANERIGRVLRHLVQRN